MPIPRLNPDKCGQRNRLAALRGYAAGSVRLLAGGAPPASEQLARGVGQLPRDEDAALALINGLRNGGEPLTLDQVHLHYAEAANASFIPDRFMFLGGSTLRNVGLDAGRGVAFMNSHRTGGLSEPTELPFGRTFCGRYEELPDGGQRALLGIYLLRGQHPNGANGPSTDELSAGINAGTIFDVSVGLYGGSHICDVCGEDLHARDEDGDYLCPHLPGTHYSMSKAQIAAQKARGVTDGKASTTYADGRMGEVSAVYDGAVPGAGFLKATNLAREGALDTSTLQQCRTAYERLCRRSDFAPAKGAALDLDQLAAGLAEFLEGGEEGASPSSPATLGSSPTGQPFDQQCGAALTAVQDCVTRAREIAALRQQQGRALALSPARREQLSALQAELSALLAASANSRADRLRRLRQQALAHEAALTQARLTIGV